MSNEPTVKRWTAKRKAAVVMDIFKGKTTVAEVARQPGKTHEKPLYDGLRSALPVGANVVI
ncbi:hypothetical protein ACFFU2_02850 [Halomonas alkalicola]|uniref:Transposase n=1 Tax=Halomonas alkalicola TaxID=1930622 RepID=A0ABY9H5L6_9GAMM|nr:hypothetical protein [Halomonas alkalicola]WLI73744.1 hypothetical protein B6N23_02045 [Halomonas alkalicola]